jgi:hypothetical protein
MTDKRLSLRAIAKQSRPNFGFQVKRNNALAAITGLWDNFPSKLWLVWMKWTDACSPTFFLF